MTPSARVQAAIECLDRVLAGEPAEKALTGWARGARYAGSKDRAAVRDHVYDALRQRASLTALAGGRGDGRALMQALIYRQGEDTAALFAGGRFGPEPLAEEERLEPGADAVDLPGWAMERLEARYGAEAARIAEAMRARAPVFLRVNLRKATPEKAVEALSSSGITVRDLGDPAGALEVLEGARGLRNAPAYAEGLVELQDRSSQAAMATLPLDGASRILDYCAGGGGKTLALAARAGARFFAHDANPGRMADLPARAARAGVEVTRLETGAVAAEGPYDLVLCDVPCSGSGTWRRDPDAKWRMMPEDLVALTRVQDGILDTAQGLVGQGGLLAYATCSLFEEENDARIESFLARHPGWTCRFRRQWALEDGGDGFFIAHLMRSA